MRRLHLCAMLETEPNWRPTRTVEMTRLIAALLATTLFASIAHAEKVAYACQFTASAGLKWSSGRWKVSDFYPPNKFEMVIESGVIRRSSVKEVMRAADRCFAAFNGRAICNNDFGTTLMFDPKTLQVGCCRFRGHQLKLIGPAFQNLQG